MPAAGNDVNLVACRGTESIGHVSSSLVIRSCTTVLGSARGAFGITAPRLAEQTCQRAQEQMNPKQRQDEENKNIKK